MFGRVVSFRRWRIGICLAVAFAAMTVRPVAAVELPRQHAWQQSLRGWLASLDSADFAIADTTWDLADKDAWTDHERLYRDWIATESLSRLPPSVQFHAAPEWFTLERIERPDGILTFENPAACGSAGWPCTAAGLRMKSFGDWRR